MHNKWYSNKRERWHWVPFCLPLFSSISFFLSLRTYTASNLRLNTWRNAELCLNTCYVHYCTQLVYSVCCMCTALCTWILNTWKNAQLCTPNTNNCMLKSNNLGESDQYNHRNTITSDQKGWFSLNSPEIAPPTTTPTLHTHNLYTKLQYHAWSLAV